jgi:hypothetical protein
VRECVDEVELRAKMGGPLTESLRVRVTLLMFDGHTFCEAYGVVRYQAASSPRRLALWDDATRDARLPPSPQRDTSKPVELLSLTCSGGLNAALDTERRYTLQQLAPLESTLAIAHVGCFVDVRTDRALEQLGALIVTDPSECVMLCARRGWAYAGIQVRCVTLMQCRC